MQSDKWLMWFLVCHNPHHSTLPLYHVGQAPGGTQVCGLIIGSSGHLTITFSPLQSDQLQESILISLPSHSYSPPHLREAPSTPTPSSTTPPPMPLKLHSPTSISPTTHQYLLWENVDREGWTLAIGLQLHHLLTQLPKDGLRAQLYRGPQPLHGPSTQGPPRHHGASSHNRPMTSQHSIQNQSAMATLIGRQWDGLDGRDL